MVYQKSSGKCSADDALHLPYINYKGTFMKIVVEFGTSNSSMPRGANKVKAPETLIEIYG